MKDQVEAASKEAEEEQEEELRKVQFNQRDDPDFNFAEFAQKRALDRAEQEKVDRSKFRDYYSDVYHGDEESE